MALLATSQPQDGYTLALSGGGARGIAHIGVIRALEDHGVPITGIAGTSMGALVGGLYACGFSGAQMDSIARSIDWDILFSGERPARLTFLPERLNGSRNLVNLSLEGLRPVLPQSALSTQRVAALIASLVCPAQLMVGTEFDSLPVPLRVIAFDLKTRERIVHSRGDLTTALLSSMAIPTAFPAVKMGEYLLVDGGVVNNLPVGTATDTWNEPVIAIDISSDSEPIPEDPSLLQVGTLTLGALTSRINEQYTVEPAYRIRPELGDISIWDFDMADSLLIRGYRAGLRFIETHSEIKGSVASKHVPLPDTFTVETLFFGGLERVRFSALSPWLAIAEGDKLTPPRMRHAIESLYASGLFNRVEARLIRSGDPEKIGMVFHLTERVPGSVGFDIGYHSEFGLDTRIDIGHKNIFNLGRQIRLGIGGGDRHVFCDFRLLNLMAESIWYHRISAVIWQAETQRPFFDSRVGRGMETRFSAEATRGRTIAWDTLMELGIGVVSHRWGSGPVTSFGRLFARLNIETFENGDDPRKGMWLLAEFSLNDPFNERSQIFSFEHDRVLVCTQNNRLLGSLFGQLCSGDVAPWQYSRMDVVRSIPGVPWQGLPSRQRIAGLLRWQRDLNGPLFITAELGVSRDWTGFMEPEGGSETAGAGFGIGILTPAGPAMLRVGRSSTPETRWTLSVGALRGFGPGR